VRYLAQPPLDSIRRLTEAEEAKVLSRLAPERPDRRDKLIKAVRLAVWSYQSGRAMVHMRPNNKLSKQRLHRIFKAACKLRLLMQEEWFEYKLLSGEATYHTNDNDYVLLMRFWNCLGGSK
jgi:hypothetical protein